MAIQSTSLVNSLTPISPVLSTDAAITVMFFCNLNTPDPLDDTIGRQFIDVHVVKNGDTATTDNQIVNAVPIDAGDTFTFNAERLVLSAGDRVHASTTDNNQVSSTISYVVI